MAFNKPRRRNQLRLPAYDYRQNGYYFVTICTRNRRKIFASEHNRSVALKRIHQIPDFFPGVSVDFVEVMPDHLHMILIFQNSSHPLGQVVQAFKSWVTRDRIGDGPIWQRNYYEHVIRSEGALFRIRKYIHENPLAEQIEWEQFYKDT